MKPSNSNTRRVSMDLEFLTERVVPAATHFYAVGQDIGGASVVRVYNEDGSPARDISPYGPGFTGGARVAVGDVNGDGTADIVAGTGAGGGPAVAVFSSKDFSLLRSFYAYAPNFAGGVFVAVGDVDGDGFGDIITGPGAGGGPQVNVFSGKTGQLLTYAHEKRVFPVSATTFTAYLQVIAMGLKGLQIEQTAPEVMAYCASLQQDFGRFREDFDVVGKHLANAQSRFVSADKRLDRFETKLERAADLEVETAAAEPPALPRALDSAA